MRKTTAPGNIALCIDPNCNVTSIILTDIVDADRVIDDLQQHRGWEFEVKERFRNYIVLESPWRNKLKGFYEIRKKLLEDGGDYIGSVEVVTGNTKQMTDELLSCLEQSITTAEKYVNQHRKSLDEINAAGVPSGDDADKAANHMSRENLIHQIKKLETSIQKETALCKKLRKKRWTGFCSQCKTEPVPLGRALSNKDIKCIFCSQ